jgi:hypothetical protein
VSLKSHDYTEAEGTWKVGDDNRTIALFECKDDQKATYDRMRAERSIVGAVILRGEIIYEYGF